MISEMARRTPADPVVRWFGARLDSELHLSVLSLAEMLRGARVLPSGHRRTALLRWIEVDVRSRFGDRLLAVTEPVADAWAELMARATREGIAMGVVDAYLAATASVHDLVLVTRNHRHLQRMGIVHVDPFEA